MVALLLLCASAARASGPVERLLQLLINPSQPDVLVVRYGAGAGSHGYLISRDGGRSFRLLCSASVSAEDTLNVQRISTRAIPSTAATVLDQDGALMYAQYGSTWLSDGTGCNWSDVPALREKWPLAFALDPQEPSTIWSVVSSKTFELMRDTNGWTSLGPLRAVDADKAVVDASLAVFADAGRRRFYASVLLMGAKGVSAGYVLSSEDGRSWIEHPLAKELERLNVLAVDPKDPSRLLAAISRDGAADTLLWSKDGGATFEPYFEPRAVGGVTFDDAGRVYVSDIGDGASPEVAGGLYTAVRLGDPLQKVPNTSAIDCVVYSGRLYVCNGDRFGVLDPASGRLDVLLRIDQVRDFVACDGKDMHALCQNQLNSGPSWCCAGHYPFTPLCDGYDVTVRPDRGRVICGEPAREYERPDARNQVGDEPASTGTAWGIATMCGFAALIAWSLRRRR